MKLEAVDGDYRPILHPSECSGFRSLSTDKGMEKTNGEWEIIDMTSINEYNTLSKGNIIIRDTLSVILLNIAPILPKSLSNKLCIFAL